MKGVVYRKAGNICRSIPFVFECLHSLVVQLFECTREDIKVVEIYSDSNRVLNYSLFNLIVVAY